MMLQPNKEFYLDARNCLTSSTLACLVSLAFMTLGSLAFGSTSTISNNYLHVPRIDINEMGASELGFQVLLDDEYLFVLQDFSEASLSVANSGAFDGTSKILEIDEIELDNGDVYSARLLLRSQSPQVIFSLLNAELIYSANTPENTTGTVSNDSSHEYSEASIAIYLQDCSACHGANGSGTASAPALIACANCSSATQLASVIRDTMPLGMSSDCDQACADDLAQYILGEFNAANTELVGATVGFIQTLNSAQTLRKATQQLLSRLPTLGEYQLAAAAGDAGLGTLIDNMMTEDAFYLRLSEIFNDYLLTDKYHSSNGAEAALSLLSSDDWPERRWFDPGKDLRDENYNETRINVNNGIAREPLALINHVVRNNLPFTEIVTADYTMVNPFSARSLGVEHIAFADSNNPEEFRPVALPEYPHAGILTSPMFLNRYPTTSTNRNRGRARVVFDLFLDTDILAIEGVRPGNAVDITTPIPTINNPECARCHSTLDPVASLFQNWDYKGRYRPARLEGGWYTDMEGRGFNGQAMPLVGNIDSSLQWLGARIAEDPRFPRAVTRIMVNGLTGKEPLSSANEAGPSSAELDAYIAERTLLNEIQSEFVADNFNLKTLVREIILSPYWRANGLTKEANREAFLSTGSNALLSPEQLDRKIANLFGFEWRRTLDSYYKDIDSTWASQLQQRYHQIYGGIDSDTVVTRLKSPNGLMAAMQLRMANELSCYAVPEDFANATAQRRLFLFVDKDTSPYNDSGVIDDSAMGLIRENIRFLHAYLLGEELNLGAEELRITEALFMDVINRGRQLILNSGGHWTAVRLHDHCDRQKDLQGNSLFPDGGEDQRVIEDRQYVMRAWMAVMAYLLADYKFFYG